jgi:hypothetical protein|tara:strand:+ start:224 stop:958 length:735 start_codon:yes stop_codon:yes gene_type:complete
MRRVSWFSCGAASAVATKLSEPDIIAYCDTGAEHEDNNRFMLDCEEWFVAKVLILKNKKYKDTWDVWEKRKFLSGISGAPCTLELKVKPRLEFQRPDDIHIFGYTADGPDITRAEALTEHWPELRTEYPLIERGLNKASCLAMIEDAGIKPPLTYAQGFPNANCLPCVKATSPAYWALVRKHYPDKFNKMAEISRSMNVKLSRINDERIFIDEIPLDHPVTKPLAPDCDFLCHIAEMDLNKGDI